MFRISDLLWLMVVVGVLCAVERIVPQPSPRSNSLFCSPLCLRVAIVVSMFSSLTTGLVIATIVDSSPLRFGVLTLVAVITGTVGGLWASNCFNRYSCAVSSQWPGIGGAYMIWGVAIVSAVLIPAVLSLSLLINHFTWERLPLSDPRN
jgi:hypothetical protein